MAGQYAEILLGPGTGCFLKGNRTISALLTLLSGNGL
ncbi:hypothetical protein CLOLEP_01925 [[Clostridium] leptum DSM 753]|uniref:Uncharacterized protein n=1 Tax=[Clostridium] leptum DSM 753 TaxID=428125 RepID=A7VTN2_9FIRM|nr:hypothetical protein CLOLEP_01925 [[Clostridium] leptum DSM 753]